MQVEQCMRDAGYDDFTIKGPSTLRDGSIWLMDADGRIEVTPAVASALKQLEECQDPTRSDEGADAELIAFMNEYNESFYACLSDLGWQIDGPHEGPAGFLYYFEPERAGEAEQDRFTADRSQCNLELYGTPDFPAHLLPGGPPEPLDSVN